MGDAKDCSPKKNLSTIWIWKWEMRKADHPGKLVLHLIDHATRFSSAGGVVPSQDRDVMFSKFGFL